MARRAIAIGALAGTLGLLGCSANDDATAPTLAEAAERWVAIVNDYGAKNGAPRTLGADDIEERRRDFESRIEEGEELCDLYTTGSYWSGLAITASGPDGGAAADAGPELLLADGAAACPHRLDDVAEVAAPAFNISPDEAQAILTDLDAVADQAVDR